MALVTGVLSVGGTELGRVSESGEPGAPLSTTLVTAKQAAMQLLNAQLAAAPTAAAAEEPGVYDDEEDDDADAEAQDAVLLGHKPRKRKDAPAAAAAR